MCIEHYLLTYKLQNLIICLMSLTFSLQILYFQKIISRAYRKMIQDFLFCIELPELVFVSRKDTNCEDKF